MSLRLLRVQQNLENLLDIPLVYVKNAEKKGKEKNKMEYRGIP